METPYLFKDIDSDNFMNKMVRCRKPNKRERTNGTHTVICVQKNFETYLPFNESYSLKEAKKQAKKYAPQNARCLVAEVLTVCN